MSRCLWRLLRFGVGVLLVIQVACAAPQARKVPCDSNLRPINPVVREKP